MIASETRARNIPAPASPKSRCWLGLAFIALAQLMVALDATVMNIALPSVQGALAFSDAHRQWVITAYTLPFAGLLLLGGRVADTIGRKPAFLIGLAGFAAASALAGASPTLVVLVAARALQGVFAAMLAPAALSLLAVTFTEPRERAKAFAVYGAIAGSGCSRTGAGRCDHAVGQLALVPLHQCRHRMRRLRRRFVHPRPCVADNQAAT